MERFNVNVYKEKRLLRKIIFAFVCCACANLSLAQNIVLSGQIIDQEKKIPINHATIEILNSNYTVLSDDRGHFRLNIPFKKHISLLVFKSGYEKKTKEFDFVGNKDSIYLQISLREKIIALDSVTIKATNKPDTLVRSGKFSIYDFDFFEDKFILLTAEKNLSKAELKLATYDGEILYTKPIPSENGVAKELYHDFMGYTNVICENGILRIIIYNGTILTFPIKAEDFNAFVKPVIDTVKGKLIFSDYWINYPMFNYYSYNEKEKSQEQLITISNADLLQTYNMEYYYMKPRERLDALEIADKYKTDKHIIAAMMSGFTRSLFYEPLYAPLFILKDTICVFDHYKDMLFHFDHAGKKLDSIPISYNHPKNWREWKRLMIKDDTEYSIYAVYSKNGHQYLKQIDYRTGKDVGKYKIQFHSAEKIKVRDGYIYYVYRPFESTQERFLYRELIRLEK